MKRGSSATERIHRQVVRLSERILEYQVRIVLDRFERSDRLVRLGVATLAGMVAVPGFFLTQGLEIHPLGAVAVVISISNVILSIHWLVRLNTSFHREELLDLGPHPHDILSSVDSYEMKEDQFADYLAHRMPAMVDSNMHTIHSISAQQGRAVLLLTSGVALHIAAIVFIAGGIILG